MAPKPRLELKPEPDGFGYLYGQLFASDGNVYRVDIMTPRVTPAIAIAISRVITCASPFLRLGSSPPSQPPRGRPRRVAA